MQEALALSSEWRQFELVATTVVLLASPLAVLFYMDTCGFSKAGSIALTLPTIGAVRGLIDLIVGRFIPRPALFGADDALAAGDITARRRVWFWQRMFRFIIIMSVIVVGGGALGAMLGSKSLGDGITDIANGIGNAFQNPLIVLQVFGLFLVNMLIFIGPIMYMGVSQIKVYEPGDADWGVKLGDIRGQAEAKEEVTKVVSLWQHGEDFIKAGGKRERGVLFLGAPGTGKTMLAKGIATSFNCPFVTIPGSGFAQMFMGMDAVLVRFLAFRAKKQAAKWGGQCIVFIDEIDAVGMRRSSLGAGDGVGMDLAPASGGDVRIENHAWREAQFAARAPEHRSILPGPYRRVSETITRVIPGMFGGGQGGIQSLLVVMDGIDDPPMLKRVTVKRVNAILDALYIVPRRLMGVRLRLKPARPRKDEIYFIGATNAPLGALDPALVRPGRMGRHINFRTPTWEDRRDIFDLYINKVAHEPDLDTPERRDEMARITNGYSPAMIDQICSMSLTTAHSDGRDRFNWDDLTEALTVVESGIAVGQPYAEHERRSVAIHEAGHAVCSHLYSENLISTRLSIKRRGDSGGHHQAMEIEDRFVAWRSEGVARLIHVLGAMAAEIVFYGQNTTGVGGDMNQATTQAAWMVGMCAMSPAKIDLSDKIADEKERTKQEKKCQERFTTLGNQIMHRSGNQALGAVVGDPVKRRYAAEFLGQAFVVAYATIRANRAGTEFVADEMLLRTEIFGNEVVELLDDARLRKPIIDLLDEDTWPEI
jgi:ATP-dependent Zn protease